MEDQYKYETWLSPKFLKQSVQNIQKAHITEIVKCMQAGKSRGDKDFPECSPDLEAYMKGRLAGEVLEEMGENDVL
jgi:hypothetical protein